MTTHQLLRVSSVSKINTNHTRDGEKTNSKRNVIKNIKSNNKNKNKNKLLIENNKLSNYVSFVVVGEFAVCLREDLL